MMIATMITLRLTFTDDAGRVYRHARAAEASLYCALTPMPANASLSFMPTGLPSELHAAELRGSRAKRPRDRAMRFEAGRRR